MSAFHREWINDQAAAFVGPPRRTRVGTHDRDLVLAVGDVQDPDYLRTARQSSELAAHQTVRRAQWWEPHEPAAQAWMTTAMNIVSAVLIGALLAVLLVFGLSDNRGDVPAPDGAAIHPSEAQAAAVIAAAGRK